MQTKNVLPFQKKKKPDSRQLRPFTDCNGCAYFLDYNNLKAMIINIKRKVDCEDCTIGAILENFLRFIRVLESKACCEFNGR